MRLKLGVITGSGTYSLPGDWSSRVDRNRFGEVLMKEETVAGVKVCHLPRHGSGHDVLSHLINHRANLLALEEWGADAILGTSVVEAVDPELELGGMLLFDDLFFPDNRLPNGEPCTIFTAPSDPDRGHYIAEQHFSPFLRDKLKKVCAEHGLQFTGKGTYACLSGPRYSSRSEVQWLDSVGAAAVSQTAAPEAVLAGELQIPYALVGYTVNYANGVVERALDRDRQREHIVQSREDLSQVIQGLAESLADEDEIPFDCGFIRRLEERDTD